MGEVIISLRNVAVRYRRGRSLFKTDYYEALKDITFEVRRGETLGVIGRNGAGKSTLLKVLSGIYSPDEGSITNHAKNTSLLTLQAGFDQNLNGRDNAVISGMMSGYRKADVLAKLDQIEEYSELGEFFYQPLSTYSSGMRARLGFATATYLRPEVLLIDEVLGVGDAKFKVKATKTMESMICSDQTVILVSHSAVAMKQLCDRVVWIDGGRVVADGEPVNIVDIYLSGKTNNKNNEANELSIES